MLTNAIAAIGACGQAILLFHSLANCYPYKVMSNPTGAFYESIAYAGVLVAPAIACLACRAVSARGVSYVPVVACLFTPAVFLVVFAVAHVIVGVDMRNTNNFDHTTPAAVFAEFAESALGLIITGVATGAVCGITLSALRRVRSSRSTP